MATFRLTPHQRRRLRAQLSTCHDARVFKRTLAMLQLDSGATAAEISRLLQVSQPTVFNWRRRFLAEPSPKSLCDRTGRGRPRLWTEELLQHLSQALLQRPERLGYAATDWTVPLLCEHLERTADQRLSDGGYSQRLICCHNETRSINYGKWNNIGLCQKIAFSNVSIHWGGSDEGHQGKTLLVGRLVGS